MASTKPKPIPLRKDTKLQLRLKPSQKELIVRAAQLRQTTVSSFLLEHACQAAEQVLAEQVHFLLPPDRWQAFCRALDAPPRERPALRRLLTETSVFDGADSAAS